MIKLDLKNSTIKNLTLKDSELNALIKKLEKYKQGFYSDINESSQIKNINNFATKNKYKYKDIVVLGIGGSALGIIALQKALKHNFENELNHFPRLHILDNIDPTLISDIEDIIDYSKTLFIVATKSGETVETAIEYFYFRQKIKEKHLNPKDHFVLITEKKDNFLNNISKKEGITIFEVPKNIAGRFSIFTPIALLPAKLIGINIEQLIKGAEKAKQNSINKKNNLAFALSKLKYSLYQKKIRTNVIMPYSQNLIGFSDWYRQLIAESLGKKGKGITPIKALGVTDQHSQIQLYNDGPKDKLIMFIELENFNKKIQLKNPFTEKKELNFLNKTTLNNLINIEKHSTEKVLTKLKRPNITIKINKIDEETLGELFMTLMFETAFLGELMKINPFNQPNVELSKKFTKEALIKQ